MRAEFGEAGCPVYCDAGPEEGSWRVDLRARLYLSAAEHARYEGAGSLRVTLEEDEGACPAGTGPGVLRPASYGVDAGGVRDRLLPGVRVIRELSAVSGHGYVTEVPCCGRPVTIPVAGGEASPVACCRCVPCQADVSRCSKGRSAF